MKEAVELRKRVFLGQANTRRGVEVNPIYQARVEVGTQIVLIGATTTAERDRLIDALFIGEDVV